MRFVLVLLALVLAVPAAAQIQTDRPSFAMNPYVVQRGTFQVEAGVPQALRQRTSVATFDLTQTVYTFSVLARYGVTETIEARVSTSIYDLYSLSEDATDTSESDGNAGFDVITVGAKVQLATNGPIIAVLPSVSIPTTEAGSVSGGASVIAGWDLTDALDLTTTLGATLTDTDPDVNVTGIAAAAVGGGLTETVGAFIELAAFPSDNVTPIYGGGGLKVLLSPNFQIDGSVDVGLNDEAVDLLFGAGLSARF